MSVASPQMPTKEELQELLPRPLLLQAFQSQIPFSKTERIDVEAVYKNSFDAKPYLPILRKLSTYGIDNAVKIDFLAAGVIPDPEDKDFPVYALGLILIIDQGPRALFDGVDSRYTNCYFDPIALKLLTQLRNLPPHLVPYNKDRWPESGFTVDHWLFSLFWFMAPITHSEVLENHDYQVQIWDYAKREISRSNDGLVDPYAEDLKPGGKLDTDMYAFATGAMGGPPTTDKLGRQVTFGDYVYWFAMIFHVHRPIIQKFGRYPYRNRAAGRTSSPEEETFCEKTHWFGAIDGEAGKAIMRDIESGRWSPLLTTE